jgi:hypothetical protein
MKLQLTKEQKQQKCSLGEIDRANTHRDNPEGFEKTKQFTGLAHISYGSCYLAFI